MGKGMRPWQDGRRAWARLNGWHQDNPAAPGGSRTHPDDGDQALNALGDVGLVRRLLDQAELVAVRTARRHGKSWAEIATRLGVTRQSAWERWRDLDATPGAAPEPARGRLSTPLDDDPAELERTARAMQRSSTVRVPDVVGLKWDQARDVLLQAGLIGVGSEPDGLPPGHALCDWDAVVVDQSPESGAKVPPRTQVTLWIGRGGSGVREPRRPRPMPRRGRAMQEDPADVSDVGDHSDEAVG
jgi:PASTA domain